MAYGSWQATVQNNSGAALPLAEITVRVGGPEGALATLYATGTGGFKANPFFADERGLAKFFAADGDYYVIGSLDGQTTDGWNVFVSSINSIKVYDSLDSFIEAPDDAMDGDLRRVKVAGGRVANYLRNSSAINGGFSFKPGFEPADTVDATLFGADGGDDPAKAAANTAAIQEAILHCENRPGLGKKLVVCPNGGYYLEGSLIIRQNYMHLTGEGSTHFRRLEDYGDTLYIRPNAAGSVRPQNIGVYGIKFRAMAAMTYGAHFHARDVFELTTRDLGFREFFGGFKMDGVLKWTDYSSQMTVGAFWEDAPEGSYFCEFNKGDFGDKKNTEIGFVSPNWCPTGTPVSKVQYGFRVNESMDGMWCLGGHVFGCKEHISMLAVQNVDPADDMNCAGIRMIGVYFDQRTDTFLKVRGNTTKAFGAVDLHGCRGANARIKGFDIGPECTNFKRLDLDGGHWTMASGAVAAVDIQAGSRISLNADFVPLQNVGTGFDCIRIRDGIKNLSIGPRTRVGNVEEISEGTPNNIRSGIRLDGPNITGKIAAVEYVNCEKTLDAPSGLSPNLLIEPGITQGGPSGQYSLSRTVLSNSIRLAGHGSIFDVTGVAGDITDIFGGTEGRMITLRGSSSGPYILRHNTGAAGSRIRTPWAGSIVLRQSAVARFQYSTLQQAWVFCGPEIVASGTGPNGSFIMYADGRMDANHVITSSASEDVTWNFPLPVYSSATTRIQVTPRGGSSTPRMVIARTPFTTNVGIAVYAVDGSRVSIPLSVSMNGRWHDEP